MRVLRGSSTRLSEFNAQAIDIYADTRLLLALMSSGVAHTVKQGEHLTGIAVAYGFRDYRVIWNYPQNAPLKQKRQNPNVLFPGDVVFIPDINVKERSCATDQRHTFQVSATPLVLKLQLVREYDVPFSSMSCDLVVETQPTHLNTDAEGIIKLQIAPTARTSVLLIHDTFEVQRTHVPFDRVFAISIGDLDPVDEISGQVARLASLGYFSGSFDAPDDNDLKSAIEEFQCEHGLKVDGLCGPKTQAKLKQVHGC